MEYIECQQAECGNPVFSRGLCRKHYEQEKLATASPCSVSGCQEKRYRGDLCTTHYREHIRKQHPLCTVPGCTNHQKTLKSGLCEKHLFRATRHGSVEQPRAEDWGARAAHPLYQTWWAHVRKNTLCTEWAEDFWVFTNAVGYRPDNHTLRRVDVNKPLGPSNWHWKEKTPSKDKAAYAREWRNQNPDKAKSHDLKKQFGIDLEEYNVMLEAQNGVCAICGKTNDDYDAKGAPRFMPVDHCHTTGKIRAILCGPCNRALGGFKDDPELLCKAAAYVESFLV